MQGPSGEVIDSQKEAAASDESKICDRDQFLAAPFLSLPLGAAGERHKAPQQRAAAARYAPSHEPGAHREGSASMKSKCQLGGHVSLYGLRMYAINRKLSSSRPASLAEASEMWHVPTKNTCIHKGP